LLNLGETQIRWLVDDMRRTLNPSDIHDMLLFSNMLSFHELNARETLPELEMA